MYQKFSTLVTLKTKTTLYIVKQNMSQSLSIIGHYKHKWKLHTSFVTIIKKYFSVV